MLIDFGLAHAAGYPETPVGGTPAFMAPELLERMGSLPTPSTDIYALGKCFEDAAAKSRNSAFGRLVEGMIKKRVKDRPESADHALEVLGEKASGSSDSRQLGGRGVQALWGGRVQPMAQTLHAEGNYGIQLPTSQDAFPFLQALKTELEIGGRLVMLAPPPDAVGQPMMLWRRMLACLVPDQQIPLTPEATREGEAPAPEDQKEALEAIALEVIDAVRSLEVQPVLMWANPDRYPHPDRHVLSRCVEAGVFQTLVVAAGKDAETGLSEAADGLLVRHPVRPPTLGHIAGFLKAHGIAEAPEGVASLLRARAGAGTAALRTLLDVWVHTNVLSYEGGHRWSWAKDADAAAASAAAASVGGPAAMAAFFSAR